MLCYFGLVVIVCTGSDEPDIDTTDYPLAQWNMIMRNHNKDENW